MTLHFGGRFVKRSVVLKSEIFRCFKIFFTNYANCTERLSIMYFVRRKGYRVFSGRAWSEDRGTLASPLPSVCLRKIQKKFPKLPNLFYFVLVKIVIESLLRFNILH